MKVYRCNGHWGSCALMNQVAKDLRDVDPTKDVVIEECEVSVSTIFAFTDWSRVKESDVTVVGTRTKLGKKT